VSGGAQVNDRGTIRGFHNVCRHRGAQLVTEPCVNRRTILCPYHRWGYALDGRLLATPSFDADADGKTLPESLRETLTTHHVKGFDKAANGLHPIRVDTALGLVFANVGASAPPLDQWLGDLLDTLGPYTAALEGGELVMSGYATKYTPACNWKVLVENFCEYYHLPAVHPSLCTVSGVDEHCRAQGRGMYMCFATKPLTRGGSAIDPGQLPPFEGLGAPHTDTAYHVCIFPNTFFSVYPDHFFRVIVAPDGAAASTETATLMTHRAALEQPGAEAVVAEMFDFWDGVNREDIAICEAVQAGTANTAYDGGRFSFRFEEPVHRFQGMVARAMLGESHIPPGDDS